MVDVTDGSHVDVGLTAVKFLLICHSEGGKKGTEVEIESTVALKSHGSLGIGGKRVNGFNDEFGADRYSVR